MHACLVISVVLDSLTPHGHGPPGFSVHGILQARILEWVVISFSIWYMGPSNFQWLTAIHRYKWSSLFKSLLTSYRHCCLTGVETVWINRSKHNMDRAPLPHQEECQRRSCQQQVSSFFCIPETSKMQKVMSCSDSRLSQATVEEGIMT